MAAAAALCGAPSGLGRQFAAGGRAGAAAAPARRPACRPAARRVAAALDGAACFAIAQQSVIFAGVAGAEAAITGLHTPASMPGRPQVAATLAGAGGSVASAALVAQGGAAAPAGCALGLAAAAFLLFTYVTRARAVPFDQNDFPGQKVWPATMALLAFFALSADFQGLRAALGML
jgi:hypothetical protein